MDHDTHETQASPDGATEDPLTELLRRGARDLLKQAVEAELQSFLDSHADGHQRFYGTQRRQGPTGDRRIGLDPDG